MNLYSFIKGNINSGYPEPGSDDNNEMFGGISLEEQTITLDDARKQAYEEGLINNKDKGKSISNILAEVKNDLDTYFPEQRLSPTPEEILKSIPENKNIFRFYRHISVFKFFI